MDVVNVVGSGSLDVELDLSQLAEDLDSSIADFDPDHYPGVYLRFDDDAPLITIYRTGKYIVTGAESDEEAYRYRDRFLDLLSEMGVIPDSDDLQFKIQNYVVVADLGNEQNLESLAIGLGLEQTEYEPEQFPGLVYRPAGHSCVLLIFASGKAVIAGVTDKEEARDVFADLEDTLNEYGLN
ncbi:TATA binding protein of transcription factor TFIID [Natrinema hispanicum]|uniref:TATA-box-binding protein n=1 Tax=Natrinema hispanicum TaxID=392421 RepID=A0A482Y328_9EURY|nr:TATA-box-binding protein [Natrinema hispanicum]RZV05204.1 TATA binding protein of transcription factor TFIID [Natrinema hispanicum]